MRKRSFESSDAIFKQLIEEKFVLDFGVLSQSNERRAVYQKQCQIDSVERRKRLTRCKEAAEQCTKGEAQVEGGDSQEQDQRKIAS